MRLEKQVCSVELAKRLKELGVAQCGQYTWVWSPLMNEYLLSSKSPELMDILRKGNPNSSIWAGIEEKGWFSAFTVAELGEMLPNEHYTTKLVGFIKGQTKDQWMAFDEDDSVNESNPYYTEADCRAALLISVLANKKDKVKNINQRLCQD